MPFYVCKPIRSRNTVIVGKRDDVAVCLGKRQIARCRETFGRLGAVDDRYGIPGSESFEYLLYRIILALIDNEHLIRRNQAQKQSIQATREFLGSIKCGNRNANIRYLFHSTVPNLEKSFPFSLTYG